MDQSKVVFIALLLGMVGSVAGIPDLEVDTSEINRTGNQSVDANRVHEYNITFSNNDSSEKIYNVTLENSSSFQDRMLDNDYISFSDNRFNINASESKTVQALVEIPSPQKFNDSLEIPYYYNDTEGNDTGIKFDANKFPQIDFAFESEWVETNISKNVLENKFELDFEESGTSTFDIENEGSENAYYINLSGQDVSFEDDNFNISRNDHRLIDFSVKIPKPDENATAKTNQTYTRTVNISGDNFESKSFDVEVFVPYKDYNESTDEKQKEFIEDLQDLQDFCNEEGNDDLPICGGEVVRTENNTKVVNQTPVYEANLTNEQLDNLANLSDVYLEDINGLRNRINNLKRRQDYNRKQLQKNFTSLRTELSQKVKENEETLQDIKDLRNRTLQQERERTQFAKTWRYGVISLVSLVLIGFGGLKAYRRLEGDELEEFYE